MSHEMLGEPLLAADADEADAPRVAKLSNMALRERVYAELGNAIRAGRFASGEVVTIRGLADILGTSTMPVREAVSRLVTEHALELLPNRSLRVTPISLARLDELTDLRMTVEGRAAALAARRMTQTEFSALRQANERYLQALEGGNLKLALAVNEEMHFGLYRAAGSALMLSVIEGLWLQSGPFIAAVMKAMADNPGTLPTRGAAHHFDIIAAIADRDMEGARKAVSDDIGEAAAWYRQTIFPDQPAADADAPVS